MIKQVIEWVRRLRHGRKPAPERLVYGNVFAERGTVSGARVQVGERDDFQSERGSYARDNQGTQHPRRIEPRGYSLCIDIIYSCQFEYQCGCGCVISHDGQVDGKAESWHIRKHCVGCGAIYWFGIARNG